ncbi:MAG TPA: hypothetical protein VF595_14305 [Tepidisphaeraceae bacterium]
MNHVPLALLVLLVLSAVTLGQTAPDAAPTSRPAAFSVSIDVDVAKPVGPMTPIWRFFGADEANYAYMKDGKVLLKEIGQLGRAQTYFRTHNLLTTGDGTPALKWGSTNAYTEDADGKPVYDWKIVDRIFDTYLANGVKPYAQVGFMPEAMSTKPQPYQHEWRPGMKYDDVYTGWAYPPKDYDKFGELVYQWVKHCVERYGQKEVESWYWQTWNEPNIGYWKGTPQEFHRLHDVSTAAIRRALPTARVGGCDTAGDGGKFMDAFLDHCLNGKNYATGEIGTKLDFLSFHAKGAPGFVDGHVRLGIAEQLKNIDRAFARFARHPQLKGTPIVIGESDPDGCAACQGKNLGYRNTTMFSSYTAASFARKWELADKHGVNLEGALSWAFEFEDQPFFAGQRVMATNRINLPVFNVFRMMAKMEGQRVAAVSSAGVPLEKIVAGGVRGAPDVSAVAATEGGRTCVLAWHYHDDDVAGRGADTTIRVTSLPADATRLRVTRYLIDETHTNPHELWKKMDSPQNPTPQQYNELLQAGQLKPAGEAELIAVEQGQAVVKIGLQHRGVALLVFEQP